MTTVINTPGGSNDGGAGIIIGVIVVIVAVVLFFVYGLPAIRESKKADTTNINVQIPNPIDPAPTGGAAGSTTQ